MNVDTRYLKHILFYVLSAAVSLLLIFYILYHLFGGFSAGVETTPAVSVTKQEVLTMDGYLFRDERLLYAAGNGDVNFLYPDGTKVGNGVNLAQIYSNGNTDLRSRIIAIDKKIALLEGSNVSKAVISDTSVIDARIWQLYYLMQEHLDRGDIEYVMHKKDEYLTLLNKRRVVTQTVVNYDSQIEELRQERNALTASLTNVSEVLRAPEPGYFYSTVDGCETIFTPGVLESLSVDSFERLIETEPLSPDEKTSKGYPVGKLVTDYVWSIACEADGEQLRQFSQSDSYQIRFPYNGDAVLSMTLKRVLPDRENERAVLVFETNVMPENFNYLRMQAVQVVRSEYKGYRVPLSAVRVVNGVQGVYIRVGNYIRFRKIKTVFETDGVLLVAPYDSERENAAEYLSEGDLIITKGKNLYDGKAIS